MNTSPIKKAIEAAGSQLELARRIGCSQAAISKLLRGKSTRPSAELALSIERESGGAVTVAELCPDFARELQRSGYIRSTPAQDAA